MNIFTNNKSQIPKALGKRRRRLIIVPKFLTNVAKPFIRNEN